MILLADESVDRGIVQALRAEGHTVEYVAERNAGIADAEVLRRSHDLGAVLLTADKDFGELLFRQGMPHRGVILLRIQGLPNHAKASVVVTAIENREGELLEAFSVITPSQIRIRRKR